MFAAEQLELNKGGWVEPISISSRQYNIVDTSLRILRESCET